MNKSELISNISRLVLIVLLVVIYFKPNEQPKQIVNELETKVIYRDSLIKENETLIVEKFKNNSKLENEIEDLKVLLDSAKNNKDTVLIIQYQDTTINKLEKSNDTLKSIISLKDTTIYHKDNIIALKDTLIDSHKKRNRLLKIKNGFLVGATAVLGGIAIFK